MRARLTGFVCLLLGACVPPTTGQGHGTGVTGESDPGGAARFAPGTHVLCRWQGGRVEYPGEVRAIKDGRLVIAYDDGDSEEITPGLCHEGTSASVAIPASVATTGPSDPRGTEDFSRGDRVECRYRGGPSGYTGSVSNIGGGYLSIDYDDGDKEQITPGLCAHFAGHGSGCSKDADCKGNRVCEARACRAPSGPVVPE